MPSPTINAPDPELRAEVMRRIVPSREDRVVEALDALRAEIAALREELKPLQSPFVTGAEAQAAYRELLQRQLRRPRGIGAFRGQE